MARNVPGETAEIDEERMKRTDVGSRRCKGMAKICQNGIYCLMFLIDGLKNGMNGIKKMMLIGLVLYLFLNSVSWLFLWPYYKQGRIGHSFCRMQWTYTCTYELFCSAISENAHTWGPIFWRNSIRVTSRTLQIDSGFHHDWSYIWSYCTCHTLWYNVLLPCWCCMSCPSWREQI